MTDESESQADTGNNMCHPIHVAGNSHRHARYSIRRYLHFLTTPPLFPRNLKFLKFWQKFSSVQKTRNYFCVRQSAGERIVRSGLFRNPAVVENRVQIKRGAAMHDGRLNPPFYHVHVAKGVRIYRSVRELPISVARALRGRFQEIAVKRNILSRQCPLLYSFAPVEECVYEIALALLFRVRNLLFCKAIDRKRFIHDVRAVPYEAFFIKSVGRIREIQRANRNNGMFLWFRSRCFYVYDNHTDSS